MKNRTIITLCSVLMLLGGVFSAKSFAQGLELKAKNGNVSAMYQLAGHYYKGIGKLQDYKQAFIWYKQAADKNNLESCYMTASMYEEGKGTTENMTNAFNYYLKAAERGHENSQMKVARMFDEGIGTRESKSRAYVWYRLCAERNESYAQRRLGDFYFNGISVNEDWTEAMYWYEKAINNNDTIAMGNLAYILYANKAVAPDYKRAESLAKIALEKDEPMAQYVYAELLTCGQIKHAKASKAMEYYKLSADNGNIFAKEVIALDTYKKTEDLTEILALEQINRGETYLILAKEYMSGEKLKKNTKQANIFFEKAAELNNEEAIAYLSTKKSKKYNKK
ncbi:MAG: sel1 repeat family protein [Bacteroidales bacterium]|nr:sel1 repeat family protein [Bacteroidales bacterium]